MVERDTLVSMVTALQNGDSNAAADLYSAFHEDIYYFILKTVDNNAELAEDLTQETFIEILQSINNLKAPAAFVTWSKQIAYHQCTAHFRKRTELLADENEDGYSVFDGLMEEREEFIPDEAIDKEDLKKTIQAMIDSLPEEQKSAILLRYFNEISVKEIAQIQGVTEGTVKSRLNYGRKAIKQSVEDYEKKNDVKLHCAGIVPLLLWLFREYRLSGGSLFPSASAAASAEKLASAKKTSGNPASTAKTASSRTTSQAASHTGSTKATGRTASKTAAGAYQAGATKNDTAETPTAYHSDSRTGSGGAANKVAYKGVYQAGAAGTKAAGKALAIKITAAVAAVSVAAGGVLVGVNIIGKNINDSGANVSTSDDISRNEPVIESTILPNVLPEEGHSINSPETNSVNSEQSALYGRWEGTCAGYHDNSMIDNSEMNMVLTIQTIDGEQISGHLSVSWLDGETYDSEFSGELGPSQPEDRIVNWIKLENALPLRYDPFTSKPPDFELKPLDSLCVDYNKRTDTLMIRQLSIGNVLRGELSRSDAAILDLQTQQTNTIYGNWAGSWAEYETRVAGSFTAEDGSTHQRVEDSDNRIEGTEMDVVLTILKSDGEQVIGSVRIAWTDGNVYESNFCGEKGMNQDSDDNVYYWLVLDNGVTFRYDPFADAYKPDGFEFPPRTLSSLPIVYHKSTDTVTISVNAVGTFVKGELNRTNGVG